MKIKSDEELKKEAKEEIEKQLKKVKADKKSVLKMDLKEARKKEVIKSIEEGTESDFIEKAKKELKKDKEKVIRPSKTEFTEGRSDDVFDAVIDAMDFDEDSSIAGKIDSAMDEFGGGEIAQELSDQIREIKEMRNKIKLMSSEELADWLIDKHESYVATMNYMCEFDFTNSTSYEARTQILHYMTQLFIMLDVYEIDVLGNEIAKILEKKYQYDLLAILNVLNYI